MENSINYCKKAMIQSLSNHELSGFVAGQVNNLFPDVKIGPVALSEYIKEALARTEYCFSKVNNKYFFDQGNVFFNHLHSDQYAMFLCLLARTVWCLGKDQDLATRIYCLNKYLHGLDVYYEVELPEIFLFVHCIGMVLGRASYSDYFVAYQRTTVGGNNRKYPQLGEGIVMYGNSAILGDSKVGNNCHISFGSVVLEKKVPSNMLVLGHYPVTTLKKTRKDVVSQFFREE